MLARFTSFLRTPRSSLARSLAMTASDWSYVSPDASDTPPYSLFTRPLEKPQVDDRQYSVIKLENGLTAMLVHDPCTDNAAASLDVAVGHLSDPVSTPHICTVYSLLTSRTG